MLGGKQTLVCSRTVHSSTVVSNLTNRDLTIKNRTMTKMTDQLVRIASAGGGMIIDGDGKMTDQLVRIASAASQSGAKIIITNVGSKMTDQLVRIASAGKGNVILDLR